MNKRLCLSLFLFSIGILAIHAQWTTQDSLKLQKFLSQEGELKLNHKEIGNIHLESPSLPKQLNQNPLMDEEKSILNFDTTLPDFFITCDSINRTRKIYLSLRPYGIFNRPAIASYIFPMAVKTNIRNGREKSNYSTSPFMPQPGIAGRVSAPIGPGISCSFSAEDLLQRVFSKKGRARLHNAEHANAWKTY